MLGVVDAIVIINLSPSYFIMFLLGLFRVVVVVVVVFVKHKKLCAETINTDIEKNMWIREIALHTGKSRVITCMTCNHMFSLVATFGLTFAQI